MHLPMQNGESLNMMGYSRSRKKEPLPLQLLQRMKIGLSLLLLTKVGVVGMPVHADILIGDIVRRPVKHHMQVFFLITITI